MQPQRLVVPLFQRPYVWNQESQWEPLWNDVTRTAERLRSRPNDKHFPHFLGAIVLQQIPKPTGRMQERTIIDGQARLTTLQILLDALHAELISGDAVPPARRIAPLVANDDPFLAKPEDRFKVWPTNRDRPAFQAVMSAEPPVDYDGLGFTGDRILEAHRFFAEQSREWLSSGGPDEAEERAAAVETVVRDLLQLVVIDLGADENAQEIFETLNARGAQLTAADLIKNFIFQRLLESGADVEDAYERNWKEFETGFWETEINVGRTRYPRSSIYLNHWLVARTGEEVVAREIFSRFKRFADLDAAVPMTSLLEQVHRSAGVYRDFVISAHADHGNFERLALFAYRTGVLESEVIKPLVLHLLDPEQAPIPKEQLTKALDVVESWMVRRMLVRATTKSYTQVVSELITLLWSSERKKSGDIVENFFVNQRSGSRYWPGNDEVRRELRLLPAYRRYSRARLRMVLEAIEDYERGWRDGQVGLGGQRVARSQYAIEHVMPRKWDAHWPLPPGMHRDSEREELIHTIGNLTLLTGKLNSKVSNGPWLGEGGKRQGLEGHDVLLLNRELLKEARDAWTEENIIRRSERLAETIIAIWPVPDGHNPHVVTEKSRPRPKVVLSDLIGAGWLQPGMPLFPRRKKFSDRVATLLPDGRIDVGGNPFTKPSAAAAAITGKRTNGMRFFLVTQSPRRSLRDVWKDYVEALSVDADDEGETDENDD